MKARRAQSPKSVRFNVLVSILAGLLLVLTFVLDLRLPRGVAVGVFYVAPVFAAFWISRRFREGYWQKLEGYIMKHSEAKFTHGLCPKCQHRYFPELFDEEEMIPSQELN